ncbi:MAG TPA: alpha/beta fold hydrolase [Candidatus Saccharimonadia bacterium]|nr:alpha/beta fold hydrolase [Candidatus Saccharimonadia bacterium]
MKTGILLSALLFASSAFSGSAAEPAASDGPVALLLTTKSSIRYGIWPEKPQSPAPTVFILANSIEGTLNSAYYRQSGNLLAKHGYICVSVDLPSHGQELREGEKEGMAGWRKRCEQGENFVEDAVKRFSAVLDELVETKVTDPTKIAACGTSRGGFMALHFAAADPRVGCVVTFGQLTDMTVLREFQGITPREMADQLALQHYTKRLAGRAIWMVIGDRDERVGTDLVISFARSVTNESLKAKLPALVELHVLAEPRGHSVPAGTADQAAEWILRQMEKPSTATPPSTTK